MKTTQMAPQASIEDSRTIDETNHIRQLLIELDHFKGAVPSIEAKALALISGMQQKMKSKSGFQGFLVKYDLSSEEGVLLMCLAEALLRVPDAHTANLLIEDKVCQANWKQHLDRQDSLFINASTWGLMLTGKMLKKGAEVIEKPNNLFDRIKSARGEPFFRKAMSQAIRMMSDQFIMGESIQKALKRAKDWED